ncbi:MAG: sigma 54-interacting transcriptional regulator [Candidatus Acidiferrales bacterium]
MHLAANDDRHGEMRTKPDNSVGYTALALPPADRKVGFCGGVSPAMLILEGLVREIARTNIPILLVGEVGTGKKALAHRIHELSQRSDQSIVKITCASMKPGTFEAELGLDGPGSEKDGLTAVGTILFDEISELDPACQRSLLYALPDGEAKPQRRMVAARVISTTNKNLDEEMRAGRFRSALYYRINGVCLRIPPLKERKEDIPVLADLFLDRYAAEFDRPRPSMSPQGMEILLEHSWPGNIRELENTVKQVVALRDERLGLAGLRGYIGEPSAKAEPVKSSNYSLKAVARAASREAERELILKVLAQTHWNRKRAAQELQISYKSLRSKLKQIGRLEKEAI